MILIRKNSKFKSAFEIENYFKPPFKYYKLLSEIYDSADNLFLRVSKSYEHHGRRIANCLNSKQIGLNKVNTSRLEIVDNKLLFDNEDFLTLAVPLNETQVILKWVREQFIIK